jgi:hypothetical protein
MNESRIFPYSTGDPDRRPLWFIFYFQKTFISPKFKESLKGMRLSLEVKGYLADVIAREMYFLGPIKIIGMKLGLNPQKIESLSYVDPFGIPHNENSAMYIVENAKDSGLLIRAVLGAVERLHFDKIYAELNSIMERTMQCRMDTELNVIPILEPNLKILEKETFIGRKLKNLGFNTTLTNYEDAIKTYKTSYKGSISLLRSTFESLVDEIILSTGELLKSNQKDKLSQLENFGIIEEIGNQQCNQCQYKKRDSEFNYSYDIYREF